MPGPLDDRKRRIQEILDSAPRAVQRSHQQYESEPPPIPSAYPATVPGVGSPSASRHGALPHVERAGQWGKAIVAVVTSIAAAYYGVKPVVVWFLTRPSDDQLEAAMKACATNAADAGVLAIVPLALRVNELEIEKKRNGQRWNQLDKVNEQKRRPNAPPPRKFGPEAERRGEARYDDGSDPE